MATTKITITLPNEQLAEIKALIAPNKTRTVSGFVKHAVAVALSDAAGWREMIEEGLHQTGGPMTKEEIEWADAIIDGKQPPPRKRRHRKAA